MTVSANDTIETYTISGTGPYSFSFRIFSESDLIVTALADGDVDPVSLSSSYYTVSGVNDTDGGSITLTSGAATTYDGYTLDIRSSVPLTQPTSIKNQGSFLPQTHETAFDRLSRQIQDLNRQVKQAFRYPDNVDLDAKMSMRSTWQDKYVYVNSDGEIEPATSIGNTALTKSSVGAVLYPQTAAEIAAGVTPTDTTHRELEDAYRTGAIGDATTDDAGAIQREINTAQKYSTGATLDLGLGQFKCFSGLSITNDRIHFKGRGPYATRLIFGPSEDGTLITIAHSGTTINQGSVKGLTLWSDDSTYTKTAIDITDQSGYLFEDIVIGGSIAIGGSGLWSGGTGSVGIKTHGRDTSTFLNTRLIAADKPIQISINPHGSISLDHHNFHNLYMIGGNYPLVTVDAGCTLTQISFTGFQAWVGGKGGLYWADGTSPGSSNGLVLENVRHEGTLDATKYFVKIDVTSPLQNFVVRGGQAGGMKGFYLRNIGQVLFDSFFYSDTSREALNVDGTVTEIRYVNARWNTGSTATVSGLQTIHNSPAVISQSLPSNGMMIATPTGCYAEVNETAIAGALTTVADSTTVQLVAPTFTGFVDITTSENIGATYYLKGTTHAVTEVSDPDGFFVPTKDNPTTYNIYWDTDGYYLQNKRGTSQTITVTRRGTIR